ncbi:ArsR family transcriptional regulator [uncultured Treponema sp.]|uniref:ArsR family transcriptional regulator n=1 Tax=uncultured Treponema sp. TaxID=162155 RepID=UPI0025F2504E|nr:ArsR family transcriptional regulator [uncultured Treponema sp.]
MKLCVILALRQSAEEISLKELQLIKMLTGGELCACKILDAFNITQPTLSHHI